MGKGTGLITACLGRELKAQLTDAVRRGRTTQSRFIRGAIAAYLHDGAVRRPRLPLITRSGEDEIRVRVSLPRSAAAWYVAAARSAGTTQSTYLRAQLIEVAERDGAPENARARAPGILSVGTLRAALVESNAHLATVERSLNQISRSLDACPAQTTAAGLENLATIGKAVTEHLDLVSWALTAIRAPRVAARRW